MQETTYTKLTDEQKALLDAAERVMETAYNPYSHFFVGAALLSQDGQTITGSNVENAAYGSTVCAERSAILRANAMGIRRFSKLAIITRGENFETKTVSASCGSCRQMMFEAAQLSDRDIEVILSTTDKKTVVVTSVFELLPLGFGPKDLGVDISKYS